MMLCQLAMSEIKKTLFVDFCQIATVKFDVLSAGNVRIQCLLMFWQLATVEYDGLLASNVATVEYDV